MLTKRRLALAACLLAAASTVAYAAGNWSTLPIVGSPSFCGSNVSGVTLPSSQGPFGVVPGSTQGSGSGICGQTIPAGPPALLGNELIPADTGITGSGPPQTVTIPSGLLGNATNRIIGGDFTTNLWQRGSTPVSNATPTTAVMAADRWWVISPSGTVDVLKTTPSTSAADYLGSIGFYSGMEVRRHTGSTGALTCVGQTLDKNAAAPLIGNNAVFSFYGYAPATYSATGENITVSVAYFTAADGAVAQSAVGAAGTNSLTAALSAAGQNSGISGYAANVNLVGNGAGSIASGVATIPLTTTPTRYWVSAPIPVTNSSGTYITAVSVSICGTFTASSAVTTDWFEIFGAQLEAKSSVATVNLPLGVTSPTNFDRRPPEVEAGLEYYYSFVETESTSTVFSHASCGVSTSSIANCFEQFPVPMRLAPAMAYTAGFQMCTTGACSAQTACTALTTSATLAFAPSARSVVIDCASSAAFGSAGVYGFLLDKGSSGGAGVISASAEP